MVSQLPSALLSLAAREGGMWFNFSWNVPSGPPAGGGGDGDRAHPSPRNPRGFWTGGQAPGSPPGPPPPRKGGSGPGRILQQAECFSELGQEMLFVNAASADTQDPGATPESAGVRERQRGSLRGLMPPAQGWKRERSEGLRPGRMESAVGSRGKHRIVSSVCTGALSLPSPT